LTCGISTSLIGGGLTCGISTSSIGGGLTCGISTSSIGVVPLVAPFETLVVGPVWLGRAR